MTWLAENALVIWAAGIVALTMALVVYWQTRAPRAQMAIAVIVFVTAALLVAEKWIETPREAVRRTIDEIAAAVRENDMPTVLRYISPRAANLRRDVETAMPLVTIEAAGIIGTPQIDVDLTVEPAQAIVVGRGFIEATLKRNGMRAPQMAQMTVTFVREGDRWRVTGYTADKDWRSAVGR